MSKYLIINADGFGFTRGINKGITEATDRGVVTSISVNSNFDAVEELPAYVKAFPQVSVGVHLNPIVGRPVADPKQVPSLVNKEGNFHYRDFTRKLLRKEIDLEEMAFELSLQIERVANMGIRVSHLDSHQNQHLFPQYFFNVFLPLFKKHNVRRMRTHAHYLVADQRHPNMAAFFYYLRQPSRMITHTFARYEMGCARKQGVLMCDRLVNTNHAGDKADLQRWLQMLRNVRDGWNEVYCHPAYPDDDLRRWASYVDGRRQELDVMTCRETKDEIKRCGIMLKSFHDLGADTEPLRAGLIGTTARN